ncbi:hypothetical protein [Sphingomonas sp. LaA6.9]|uniref:hypothetical protein n=1 Tax=Sphingomonas sp. LaA6.9 TaxID=2919914 RepID=UPI001F4F21C8|nr:hypothetical protein [Sphingomonas sp. LaA6.9]MCJ8157657.1 hypothetical protein [Sphingomonas sp. LaA6.9]
MKIIKFAVCVSFCGTTAPAIAQSIPDDLHCLALSNSFWKSATEEPAREGAAKASLFYLGRLDARADRQAITNAMRALSPAIDPKTASAEMSACTNRITQAAQAFQALGNAASLGK